MAEIDKILQGCIGFSAHLFNRTLTTVDMRIHGAGIDEDKVLEVPRKYALHP